MFGFLTKPLITALLPHHSQESTDHKDDNMPKDDIALPFLSADGSAGSGFLQAKRSLSMLLERPVHTIHAYWRKFDDKYMRPVFGGPN